MNTEIYIAVITIICGYLIGSFPAAYIMGRLRKGVDIRKVGSRNMGAMNVIYSVGMVEGIMVLLIDVAKGALAVFLARWLGTSLIIQLVAGAAAIIGHIFPVFLKFRGGKGGATSIGVLVFLMPWVAPIGLPIFGILVLITRFPTLSYGVALGCCPLVAWLVYHSGELVIFSLVILIMLWVRYIPRMKEMIGARSNWRRVAFRRNLKDRL